ncbi:MAG: hypothetical protein KC619_35740 [Myxococcales bacterium]|nr:hypothetical protein [Myxococcales bacterium]
MRDRWRAFTLVSAGLAMAGLASCSEPASAPAPPEPRPAPPPVEPIRDWASTAEALPLEGAAELSCEDAIAFDVLGTTTIDAVEVWTGQNRHPARGERCAGATDRDACEDRLAGFPPAEGPEGDRTPALVFTGPDGAFPIRTRAALLDRTGPVDTLAEAFFTAHMAGYSACGPSRLYRRDADGFVARVLREGDCGAGTWVTLAITPSGEVSAREQVDFPAPADAPCE